MSKNIIFDKIGSFLGFNMWNNRNKNLQYGIHGCLSESDDDKEENYIDWEIKTFKNQNLIIYKRRDSFYQPAEYVLNFKTYKPTKNSNIKTLLTNELIDELKLYYT
jgi:hypothetical protein